MQVQEENENTTDQAFPTIHRPAAQVGSHFTV
jgi:hypothetical protein